MSDPSSSGSSYRANLQRGQLLREQGRYPDAEKYLMQAIAAEVSNAEGYYQLAFCYCNWTGHATEALEAIDLAISYNPANARFFALRAWILGNLKRYKQAIESGDQALALNPANILALNAQARAYRDLAKWGDAEAIARRALELDAENETAANLLAVVLRQQGRLEESNAVSANLLARVPNDPAAQANAGWTALHKGDHRSANRHFLESLRLDPNCDYARRGLLHSFNSRVWIYRIYFQFIAWLGRHRKGMRYFLLFVIYIVYRLFVGELRTQFGKEGEHWAYVVVCLYLVVIGFGRSFANLFLLLDPFARHALKRKEIGWSLFAALLYGFCLTALVADSAWVQASVLIGILIFFAWGVLQPRIMDAVASKSGEEGIAVG
jgi:Tfp pilus assembly protein PilF